MPGLPEGLVNLFQPRIYVAVMHCELGLQTFLLSAKTKYACLHACMPACVPAYVYMYYFMYAGTSIHIPLLWNFS